MLSLDSFYKHSEMKGGRLNKCKDCTKKDAKENRMNNLEYYRAFDKARASKPSRVRARKLYAKTPEGKEAHKRANKRWEQKHPLRKKASQIVSNAIRDGMINKQPCFVCGSHKAEAHHFAYDMPLDVTWLCVKHHTQLHKEFREAA